MEKVFGIKLFFIDNSTHSIAFLTLVDYIALLIFYLGYTYIISLL